MNFGYAMMNITPPSTNSPITTRTEGTVTSTQATAATASQSRVDQSSAIPNAASKNLAGLKSEPVIWAQVLQAKPSSANVSQSQTLVWPSSVNQLLKQDKPGWAVTIKYSDNQGRPKLASLHSDYALPPKSLIALKAGARPNQWQLDLPQTQKHMLAEATHQPPPRDPPQPLLATVAKHLTSHLGQPLPVTDKEIALLAKLPQLNLGAGKGYSPQAIKQWLEHNGEFHEAMLVQHKSPKNTDSKSVLPQLVHLLSQPTNISSLGKDTNPTLLANLFRLLMPGSPTLTPEANTAGPGGSQQTATHNAHEFRNLLRRMAIRVLQDIQTHQLKQLADKLYPPDQDTQQTTVFDTHLPWYWPQESGTAHLKVSYRDANEQEPEQQKHASKERLWQFDFTMTLPGDRHLTARCTLKQEHCRVQFWAQDQDLKTLIEHEMTQLHEIMAQDGIRLDYGGCALGPPPDKPPGTHYPPLVDTSV